VIAVYLLLLLFVHHILRYACKSRARFTTTRHAFRAVTVMYHQRGLLLLCLGCSVDGELPAEKENDDRAVDWSAKIDRMITEKVDLGEGRDVVLETTSAQPCILTHISHCQKGGTYAQAGMERGFGHRSELPIPAETNGACRTLWESGDRRVSST